MQKVVAVKLERTERQSFNPHTNIMVRYRGKEHELEAKLGLRESVQVFREGPVFFVLHVDSSLPFVSLAGFDVTTPTETIAYQEGSAQVCKSWAELSLEEWQVDEALGKRGVHLPPARILRQLMPSLIA